MSEKTVEQMAEEFYEKRFVTAFGGHVAAAKFTPLQITSGTFLEELAAFGKQMRELGYREADKEWRESQRYNGYNEGQWSV